MNPQKDRPIDLLRAANKNKILEIRFAIPLDGDKVLNVILKAPDIYAIWEAQELAKRVAMAEATDKGLAEKSVSDKEWAKYLERFTDKDTRKSMESDRPANQAEKYALDVSYLRTIRELVPRFLCTTDGAKAFPTQAERDEFSEIMCSNREIMNLLTDKYIELSKMVKKAQEAIKN